LFGEYGSDYMPKFLDFTTGNSYVPLNLYSLIIGKSGTFFKMNWIFSYCCLLGYGKSDILSRVERGVKYCAFYHAKKFVAIATKRDIP
jgi:hypothetical protein